MRLLNILLFSITILSCKTQKNTQLETETITIDFANLEKTKLTKKASQGSLVNLKIININTNQYDAQINNTQTNYFTSQPEIMGRLNPDIATVTDQTIVKQVAGSNFAAVVVQPGLRDELQSLNEKQKEFSDNLSQFISLLEEYKSAVGAIKTSLRLKSMLSTIAQDCSNDVNTILTNADTEVKTFVTKYQSIISPSVVGTNHTILKGQLRIVLESNLTMAEQKYKQLGTASQKVEDVTPEFQENIKEVSSKISKLLTDPNTTTTNRAQLDGYKLIIDKLNRTLKSDLKRYDEVRKSINESNSFVQLYDSGNELSNIVGQYGNLTPEKFTVTSAEIIDKDELLFTVKLQQKPNSACKIQTINLPIRVRSRGGFKMDFSSGLFLNFGKNDFFNQTYRLQDADGSPDNYTIVKNENRSKVLPSIGAMLHGYVRTGGIIQPAIAIGLSLSAGETSRLNYHFGPSLIIGKEQRFIASFGWTLAESNILDGRYKEGDLILKTTAPETVPTTSYFRWGNFFSLSYNLSK